MFKLRYLSIRRLVFLVKSIQSGTEFFTQYVKADVIPKKVFFCGHDVTKFLTFKSTLSQFSYVFLCNLAFEHVMTVREVRTFFRINNSKSVKRVRKVVASCKQGSRIIRNDEVKSVEQDSTPGQGRKRKLSTTSDSGTDANVNVKRREQSSSVDVCDLSLGARLLASTSRMENSVGLTAFKKYVVFDAAFKLMVCNLVPDVRFPVSRAEMYFTLVNAGLPYGQCMSAFQNYLTKFYPSFLQMDAVKQLLDDILRFSGRRIVVGSCSEVSYSPIELNEIKRRWSGRFTEPFSGLSRCSF